MSSTGHGYSCLNPPTGSPEATKARSRSPRAQTFLFPTFFLFSFLSASLVPLVLSLLDSDTTRPRLQRRDLVHQDPQPRRRYLPLPRRSFSSRSLHNVIISITAGGGLVLLHCRVYDSSIIRTLPFARRRVARAALRVSLMNCRPWTCIFFPFFYADRAGMCESTWPMQLRRVLASMRIVHLIIIIFIIIIIRKNLLMDLHGTSSTAITVHLCAGQAVM